MNIDMLVDNFVAKINSGKREPGFEYEITPSVRTGEMNGLYDWNIKLYPDITWIKEIEKKLPAPFPASYKSLIARYIFPYIEVGPMLLMANTPEGVFPSHELRTGLFKDKVLSDFLLQNGYIQFARPANDTYDPICFDIRNRKRKNEYPIVQIDHEGIFIKNKIIIQTKIAESFADFMEEYLIKV